jgi:subtilase family serine protease
MLCSSKSACLALALAAFTLGTAYSAQAEAKRQLVTGKINDNVVVPLVGNTRPEATALNDRGPVSLDLQFDHLMLVLKRPAELDAQLTTVIDQMHTPGSANFHKWMSAEQFGELYGPAQSDVSAVRQWLEAEGFTVNVVYANNMFIDFSGTAGQVETAFHTEIHNFEVNGVMHIANTSDPQIPAALGQVVSGVASLNDFRPKAMHERVRSAATDPKGASPKTALAHTPASETKSATAQFDNGLGDQAIVPFDLELIYNIAPLLSAGISGQGMKIVLLEDSDQFNCNASGAAGRTGTPCSATSDWATFRNRFGLSKYTAGSLSQENPQPQTGINNCQDPGVNGDDDEAAIDVQWASAAAPSATLVSAGCADPRGSFGGLIALQNIMSHPNADNVDVVSMSFGESEENTGATLNAAFNSTFQQAVAAGIAIFVSSGDEDAASSDHGGETCTGFPNNGEFSCAEDGINISGWMSSPYDVSVGGLDFADVFLGESSDFFFPFNNEFFGSARSYVPEQPWNDSCAGSLLSEFETGSTVAFGTKGFCNTTLGSNFLEAVGGSGGPSSCATGIPTTRGVSGGTCAGWAKPSYQSQNLGHMAGLVNDKVRDTPDVALMAANGLWGHFYPICFTDPNNGGVPCSKSPADWPGFGGTSVSSPIFAAIQSLVVQHKGSLQGNPNPRYYALAAAEYGPNGSAACNSSKGAASGASCVFHDVTLGDNDSNCQVKTNNETHTTTLNNCFLPSGAIGVLSTSNTAFQPAYLTTTGWDFASGIGSVNAFNLVMSY